MEAAHPEQPNEFARNLFAGLANRYDHLSNLLSLGQDRRWRRAMVDAIVATSPTSVLDVATGTAGVALQLAERTPAHVTGVDLTTDMLRTGRASVLSHGRSDQVCLLAGRAEELPFADATFDALTFTYLLRYVAEPVAVLRELARVVKPGGVIANLEFHVPTGRFWRGMWTIYTRLLLPATGRIVGGREWYDVGRFLGPSISQHYRSYPLDWQVEAWQEAGITGVEVHLMSRGGGLVMSGHRVTG